MYAMNNIKVCCQSCRNERFFKKYQPIDILECPECNSKINIYSLDSGLYLVEEIRRTITNTVDEKNSIYKIALNDIHEKLEHGDIVSALLICENAIMEASVLD